MANDESTGGVANDKSTADSVIETVMLGKRFLDGQSEDTHLYNT